MDNVYDRAHELARLMKDSPQGRRFFTAQEKLKANPDSYRLAKDFFPKQLSVQTRQMLGQTISPEEVAAFNQLATSVMTNPEVSEYIQAQMAFFPMYQDIMKILSDAIGLDSDIFGPGSGVL